MVLVSSGLSLSISLVKQCGHEMTPAPFLSANAAMSAVAGCRLGGVFEDKQALMRESIYRLCGGAPIVYLCTGEAVRIHDLGRPAGSLISI